MSTVAKYIGQEMLGMARWWSPHAQETAPGGRLGHAIGIVPARLKIGLQNLVYNIRRLATLERASP